ncbi:MAG: hypothetical protein RSD32_08195 [Oscillospiraceae bacterium]
MPYYHECPECGCNLDPGETCDCITEKAASDAGTSEAAGSAQG